MLTWIRRTFGGIFGATNVTSSLYGYTAYETPCEDELVGSGDPDTTLVVDTLPGHGEDPLTAG